MPNGIDITNITGIAPPFDIGGQQEEGVEKYLVYRGQDGAIDYENPVAVMQLDDEQISIPNQALPPNTIWHYIRRHISHCGLESSDSPVCIIQISATGEMFVLTPNKPLQVTINPIAEGKFLLRWRYSTISEEIPPTEFHVYLDSGEGFNFSEPTAIIEYGRGGRGEFKWESDSYPNGQRCRFCVRSYAEDAGESQNTNYVAAIADEEGPEAIIDIYATVEQL